MDRKTWEHTRTLYPNDVGAVSAEGEEMALRAAHTTTHAVHVFQYSRSLPAEFLHPDPFSLQNIYVKSA
jgi:hypothetical protein